MIHAAEHLPPLALLAAGYGWGLLCGLACGVGLALVARRWVEP